MAVGDVGRLIGDRYRVDRELGRGPGTQSLLVTDLRSGRPGVLRQLFVALATPAAARRFEAHAAILAKLDHPGLPRFIDGFSEGAGDAMVRSLVTSYHPGENLERLVGKGRALTESQALVLLRRIAAVLVYLHAVEPPLVHRTIRATGIILGPDSRPCLTDLDYALSGQSTPVAEEMPPDPDDLAHAAPEVFVGGAVPASDIYALGLAICRGMSAKDPAVFPGEGARAQLRVALGVSEAFATVLARMLEASAERRYADARALDADLAKLTGVRGATAPPAPARAAEAPQPRRKRRPLVVAGVALALLALAAVVVAVAVRLRNKPVLQSSLLVPAEPQEQPAAPPPGVESGPTAVPAIVPAVDPPAVVPALPVDTTAAVAEGRLMFGGKLFQDTAAPAPLFWFRKEGGTTEVKPRVDHTAGVFTVRGLAPGRYAVSVRVNLEPGNPNIFPGDLTGWEEFMVEAGRATALDVSLRTVMRLVQPVDNGVVIPGWDVPCGAGNAGPGKIAFSWAALAPGTTYVASVDRLLCGRDYARAERVFTSSAPETRVNVDLPPNKADECYSFRLTASRDGNAVGVMSTHGKSGLGWDYRFTVAGR